MLSGFNSGGFLGARGSIDPGATRAIFPPQIPGNVNNYSPTGWIGATRIFLDADPAGIDITGFQATEGPRAVKYIVNVGAGTISLLANDLASDAANRMTIPGAATGLQLPTSAAALLLYINGVSWLVYNIDGGVLF